MSYESSKLFGERDAKRSTMFPFLRHSKDLKPFRARNTLGQSLDETAYRLTSHQLLKGVVRHHDSEITKLRTTFFKQPQQEVKVRKVGPYKVLKEVGKGGFAQIYEVEDDQGRKLALK